MGCAGEPAGPRRRPRDGRRSWSRVMADSKPRETKNLDGYGFPPLPWRRPHGLLAAGPTDPRATFFLATVPPNQHSPFARIGEGLHDGEPYFKTRPRNLTG